MSTPLKETVLLPKTDFPMKANLAQREPQFLERWEKVNLYQQIMDQNKNKPKFVLHDGPPYANGNIHLGHIMNKTLKDIIIKSKTMAGFLSPYVPGWDCHGLPIEHQVMKNLGSKGRTLSKVEIRQECRTYAEKYVEIQRNEFKRIGVFGDWENPYRTMDFSYQAQIAREFAQIVEKGFVFRSRKALHWCISCETALAEAEIEYADHKSPSIFVLYPITEGTSEKNAFAMIWTTTPWTLPASMAISYSEKEEYVWVSRKGKSEKILIAKPLLTSIQTTLGLSKDALEVVGSVGKGTALRTLKAKHPFLERTIPFLPGDHVTMEAGTGLVHTAPGHGEEDFEMGVKFGIDAYSPVMGNGRFEPDVPLFAGLKVFEANPKIIEHLKSIDRLFENEVEITHSYPHCWRCKKPVIFRATSQWFLSLKHQELRQKTLDEIDRVKWVPQWGRDRIHGMISGRPDWCLSRQRVWGVPIIVFFCKDCGEHLLSPSIIRSVADLFEKESADAWFTKEAAELLPKGTACKKCGKKEFEKGKDILDVWFDSGASHAAVLEKRPELSWPADVYLEGSDQHRGWFHSSLLEGMASRGHAPYKSVVTHGFVVDGQGKKMSKSFGNYISAQDIMKDKGAEMLRLWVATEDYRNDVRLSNEIMERVIESYRRMRNTARFCLGNLFDFNPDKDCVPFEKLEREIDHWALIRLSQLQERVKKAYETYEFHQVVAAFNDFCVVDLSSLYLDIAKDILYCDGARSPSRRSVQTLLFEIVKTISLLLAPILPATAEEIWDFIPAFSGKKSSVHLASFPELQVASQNDLMERFEQLRQVRSEVSKVLEQIRAEKKIGQSLQAKVTLKTNPKLLPLLQQYEKSLPGFFIVSRVKLDGATTDTETVQVTAEPIDSTRCERCWNFVEDVKQRENAPLCDRCAEVVKKL